VGYGYGVSYCVGRVGCHADDGVLQWNAPLSASKSSNAAVDETEAPCGSHMTLKCNQYSAAVDFGAEEGLSGKERGVCSEGRRRLGLEPHQT
jgi:hypothetical protein